MMTGGPAKDEASALEGLTDEEKEKEARELHDLIQKLNESVYYYLVKNFMYELHVFIGKVLFKWLR